MEDDKERYFNKFRKITTNFVQKSSEIEWQVIRIIANHFCGNYVGKKLEFIALMHDYVISYKVRMHMFTYIMKTHHKDILKQRESFLQDIEKFINIRNQLCHRVLAKNTTGNDDTFILMRPVKSKMVFKEIGLKNMYDDYILTKDEHNKQITNIKDIIKILDKLAEG